MDFLETEVLSDGKLSSFYGRFRELYTRKLWHQLTNSLLELISDESFQDGARLLSLYEQFIAKFESKINQLQFARMIVGIAKKIPELGEKATLLERTLEKRSRLGTDAALLLDMELAIVRLHQGRADEVKDAVEKGKEVLESLLAAETIVHSSVYRAASEYHKVSGPPEEFYKNALMLLAYTPASSPDLSTAEKISLATDISLAAITGDGVFNFGEVLATPILSALEGTPNAWLSEMMRAFHMGDVDKFAALVGANHTAFHSQLALASREEFIREKMALLALINMVFERPSQERSIKFQEIAVRTRLPLDQVEWLAMRAMSLGLIKGVMDGVDQELTVSWVQPRVLDMPQLKQLCSRFQEWKENVKSTLAFVEDQTPELFN